MTHSASIAARIGQAAWTMLATVLVTLGGPAAPAWAEPPPPYDGTTYLRGVNVAGAEFGRTADGAPGRHATDYIYPAQAYVSRYTETAFLAQAGLDLFRLPVRWERLQPELFQPLDADELDRMITTIEEMRNLGAYVMVDVHNYAQYYGTFVGTDALPNEALADLWSRLATALMPYPEVMLGLMNEPHTLPPGDWVVSANAAIAAIRATGARHLITVPGVRWTGAHSWFRQDRSILDVARSDGLAALFGPDRAPLSNAEAVTAVIDPLDHFVIEVHQYLDHDSSGRHETCVSVERAGEIMDGFTGWLRENGLRGFLGEIGVPNNPECLAAFDALLADLAADRDLYIGIAYWAVGPWWRDGYPFRLAEGDAADPRLRMLLEH